MRVDPSLLSSKNGLGMSGLRCTFARVLGVGSALTYALDRRLTLPASAVSRCPCAAAAAAEAAVSTQRKSVSTQTSHGFKRGESVCMRGRQTARLLQPRAPSHSLTTTHMPAHIVCAIRAPQPTLNPRAHAPRETRGEYRASLRQSASVEPCWHTSADARNVSTGPPAHGVRERAHAHLLLKRVPRQPGRGGGAYDIRH